MFYHVIEHFFDQTKTFEILKKRLKKWHSYSWHTFNWNTNFQIFW